jgi:hypothetical protein
VTDEAEDRERVRDSDYDGRRAEIAADLVQLGFISSQTARADNPAVDVLAVLLAPEAELAICLTCHEFSSTGSYAFRRASDAFKRPTTPKPASTPYAEHQPFVPIQRTEIVLCTQDALAWTRSQAHIQGARVREDYVTLYSVPFADVLGATVHDQRKGVVEAWIDEGPTLSFRVTPAEAESLASCIDRAATTTE